MYRKTVTGGALITLFAATAMAVPANATVTFNSASISVSTAVKATRGATTNNNSSAQAIAIPVLPASAAGTISSAVALVKTGVTNHIQANASSTGVAYFADATSGTFDGSSGTSIVQGSLSTLANPISAFAKAGGYNFVYNFTLTGATLFELYFDLDDPNAPVGNTVLAALSGPIGGFSNILLPNSAGLFSSTLGAGSYALNFASSYENVITRTGFGIGQTTGKSIDHFSFTLTEAVPEPASWLMMIAGFAAIGWAMRRRQALALA